MKSNTFKIIKAFSLMLFLFPAALFAQSTAGRFSIGAELAMPTSTYGDRATTGFGGSLRYEKPLGQSNFAFMLTSGYLSFGAKSASDAALNTYHYTNSAIPIQLGLKLYLMGMQKGFYIDGEAGVHLLSTKSTVQIGSVTTSSS